MTVRDDCCSFYTRDSRLVGSVRGCSGLVACKLGCKMLMPGPHSRPLRPPYTLLPSAMALVGASCPVALRMAVACYDYNTVGQAAARAAGGMLSRWLPRTELFPHPTPLHTHLGLQATTTTTRTPLVTTTMTRATTTTRQSTTTPPDRQVRMAAVRALTGAWELPPALSFVPCLMACCAPPLVLALVPQTRERVEGLPLPLPPPQVLRRRRPWSTMRMSSGSCMHTQ